MIVRLTCYTMRIGSMVYPSAYVSLQRLLSSILLFFLLYAPASLPAREVRVGIYENAPKVFTDDSGRPAGIFVDVIEEIAAREGWQLVFVHGSWTDGLDHLADGEIDLMSDVAQTADRDEIYDFHEVPVISSWFQVYAPKGSGIRSLLDLQGKRIVVLERSVQQQAFDQLVSGFDIQTTILSFPDYQTCFEKVAIGEADAAVTNRLYGVMHAEEYGLEDTAVIFHPSNLYFAAPEGMNEDLLRAIDVQLARLKEDSQSVYYKSLERWTSEKVDFILPDWVRITGLAAMISLVLSLAAGFTLKRRVDVQTRELREINKVMEARIEIRTAELAAAMERAKAADHLKSAFLATMSHELRTPLNSIIGFTGILIQQLPGPLNDEQHKQLGMVQTSARHLLALINDVLDISKIEAGQLDLSISDFDVRSSIEKMASMVRPLAEKKQLELRARIADDVTTTSGDQRRFEQVILNLLNNAVKFTDQGHVEIACHREGNDYLLSVTDTGIGIPEQSMQALFQPFHQIDSGLARKHEGTGLGLSISKKLVQMMGGSIMVQSQLGKGSTFIVRFPVKSGAPS